MSHTTGDPTAPRGGTDQGEEPIPRSVWLTIGALALCYLGVVGVGMWFVGDITEAAAPVIGDDPLAQRITGWAVWAVFLLPVAVVFLRAARNRARGTPASVTGRWATAVALLLLSMPGVVTFGGRGGPDEETGDALRAIGRDFALGVQLGRVGAVVVVFVSLGFVIARRKAIADPSTGTVAFLRTPAYAALAVLAITLVAAILLEPA